MDKLKALARVSLPLVVFGAGALMRGQELIPRAYVVAPVGANAVTLSGSWSRGNIAIDASSPIQDITGSFQTQIFSYSRSQGLFGRSANLTVSLPYAFSQHQAAVFGVTRQVYRSGLADARVRLSVNLRGAPAMQIREFLSWSERNLIGVSVSVVVPIGQYDSARVVNVGTNRWALKPEIGLSRRRGRWVMEGYAGVWLFARNARYYPGNGEREQRPMGAIEFHLGYYLKPRLWASLDGNFWAGGRTVENRIPKPEVHRNSRGGVTVSTPITHHQSIKFSYSRGAYVRTGADYQTLSAAWQYSWLTRPK